ncbi:hypothetical protein FBQ96_04520 [Nitrospirales bacterium NOB]|nr:hypothetical protein [Nitrospirales bacterium NOB]
MAQDKGCREHFVSRFLTQPFFADFPSRIAGDPQSTKMRLNAIIQLGEIVQRIVRRKDSIVAKQPQKGGFFGVQLNNTVNDVFHHAKPICCMNRLQFSSRDS